MLKRFRNDESGAAMVEMSLVLVLLLVLTLGFVDFGHAFYQWNAAGKAVQAGARMASVSNPVATGLTTAGPSDVPGAPMVAGAFGPFVCTSGGGGSCTGYNAGNFTRIFADALEVLDHPSPEAETGLTPRGCFPESEAMLQAAMASWVFGGMGSWNDLGFDGAAREEYEKVSADLYGILNEVIAVAASGTAGK